MGLLMILFPKLSEWLFRYNEDSLRLKIDNEMLNSVGNKFYEYKLKKCETIIEEIDEKHMIMMKLNKNINYINIEKLETEICEDEELLVYSYRKFKAFINYRKLFNLILFKLRFRFYSIDRSDKLPNFLTPLSSHRIEGQMEKYETRMYDTKNDLYKALDMNKINKNDIADLYRNRKLEKNNLEAFLNGRELDIQDLVENCSFI